MIRVLHFHFYSKIFFAVAVGAMALFLWQKSIQTEAIPADPLFIRGWAYSSVAGWISLNCNNDFDGDGELDNNCAPINYGLQTAGTAQTQNTIEGCAWAGQSIAGDADNNLGWICFSNQGGLSMPELLGGASDNGVDVGTQLNTIAPGDLGRGNWPSIRKLEPFVSLLPPTTTDNQFISYFTNQAGDSDPDFPTPSNPIEGCFNCYYKTIYACVNSITTTYIDDPTCGDNCSGGGDVCVPVDTENFCENCMEYHYYDGSCSHNGQSCQRDSDCGAGNTCDALSTCSNTRYLQCDPENGTADCGAQAGICKWQASTNCDDDSDCTSTTTDKCLLHSCDLRPVGTFQRMMAGFLCSDCTIDNYDNTCDLNAYGYNRNRCAQCGLSVTNPGLLVDNQNGRASQALLCGWAYNEELGWTWFSPKISSSTKPYISVEGGSIYARDGIYSPYTPPIGRYNASYLIESGGNITNFISSSTLSGLYAGELKNRPLIDFFSPINTKYKNILGSIDYTGLITPYANGLNKYGSEVESIEDSSELSGFAAFISGLTVLDGKIFYIPFSAIGAGGSIGAVAQDIDINNAAGRRASGIIVLDGSIELMSDVLYQDNVASIDNLKEINSLVWIVKGDLIIHPSVTNLAGTFIVLGNGTSCDGPTPTDGCGRFISCDLDDGLPCDQQLRIEGSVLAKRFELLRDYYEDGQPAELFINNGRLQANSPPGLTDFGRLLPRFIER